jgi:hypothetical protein
MEDEWVTRMQNREIESKNGTREPAIKCRHEKYHFWKERRGYHDFARKLQTPADTYTHTVAVRALAYPII